MYKGASQSLQRKHRVTELRPAPSAYVCEDDLIQSAANMGLRDCEDERRTLLTEKTRLENELVVSKRDRDKQRIEAIGHRLANISARLGMLKRRLHQLRNQDRQEAMVAATKQIVSAETFQRIVERAEEIILETPNGPE
jgi:phosphoglucomutase